MSEHVPTYASETLDPTLDLQLPKDKEQWQQANKNTIPNNPNQIKPTFDRLITIEIGPNGFYIRNKNIPDTLLNSNCLAFKQWLTWEIISK